MANSDEKELVAFGTDDIDEPEEDLDLCCPSTLSCCLSTVFCPCTFCGWIKQVNEKEEYVLLNWGEYAGRLTEPGLNFVNPCGISMIRVSTKQIIINIDTAKVLDLRGNPIVVSGVLTYHVVNSKKCALNVQNSHSFISNQALAVMKSVCARYPYQAPSADEEKDVVSLRGDTDEIKGVMVEELQKKVDVAGVEILSFELTDLAYSKEIAQAMLVKQQAEAMIEARMEIVSGAVDIVHNSIEQLEDRGISLSNDEVSRLATNLLIAICGDQNIQPTIGV